MLSKLKNTASKILLNSKGSKMNRKVVVLESDDWGSIRMPNKNTLDRFESKSFSVRNNPYCRFDTVESVTDLEALFSTLRKYKDHSGNFPVITANTVMANPDFEKIRATDFKEYFYQPFTETLKQYYPNENVWEVWSSGVKEGLLKPQFHGREHVNVPFWLEQLQQKDPAICSAFDLGFWGVPKSILSDKSQNIQATYGSGKVEDLSYQVDSIRKGLQLFHEIFNFQSETVIANNYTWSSKLNPVFKENGVLAFQGMKYQKSPMESGEISFLPHFFGEKNQIQQTYLVRNCAFEPSQRPTTADNVGDCLKEMSIAFLFNKPAIITTHRLNFIGGIDLDNREKNLQQLSNLLSEILKKWPDVEFMTSDQLVNQIFFSSEK